jgi:Family of unknown function (DUF6152)
MRSKLAVAVLGLVLAHAAGAHHSQSEFDPRKRVELTGKVTRLDWRSPHARIYIDVVDAEGKTVNWDFELPSPTTLMRRGWTRNSLQPGDQVTVTGMEARNHPAIGYATTIKDKDGKPMFTGKTEIYEPEKEAEAEAGK